MGRMLLSVLVGAVALLAVLLFVSAPGVDPLPNRSGGPLRSERSSVELSEAAAGSLFAVRDESAPEPDARSVAAPVAGSEAETATESVQPSFRLDLRLVAEADGEPLPFWRVAVCEPRHRYGPKEEHRNARADGSGQVSVQGLPHSGPWEVVVYDAAERASEFGEDTVQTGARLPATDSATGAPHLVVVDVGLAVHVKSPLPLGVEAEDLVLELRWPQRVESSNRMVPAFARATRARDGTVRARLPLPGGMPAAYGALGVFTLDRAWECWTHIALDETHLGEVVLDVPFEPRGRLRVRVVPRERATSDPDFWSLLRSAMTVVSAPEPPSGWRSEGRSLVPIPGQFPPRLEPDIVEVTGGVFEIRGLALAEYELAPEREGVSFSRAPLRMVATQGMPPVVVIHVDDAR